MHRPRKPQIYTLFLFSELELEPDAISKLTILLSKCQLNGNDSRVISLCTCFLNNIVFLLKSVSASERNNMSVNQHKTVSKNKQC